MSEVYNYPHYYALGYRWNTDEECDFVEACLAKWHPQHHVRILDLGCGAGRHVLELAARGFDVTGVDPAPAMVAYAQEQALYRGLDVTVVEGALERFSVEGRFDAALCVMDTFRFLLTDEAILRHLQQVAACLAPAGLCLTDFWMPRAPLPPDETHEWEQRSETTHIRVEYRQYPESWDAASSTFDDELIFHVSEDGDRQTIRGGRTRTRLLLPETWTALVERSGCFRVCGQFDGFDLRRPYTAQPTSWRMVTVLQALDRR